MATDILRGALSLCQHTNYFILLHVEDDNNNNNLSIVIKEFILSIDRSNNKIKILYSLSLLRYIIMAKLKPIGASKEDQEEPRLRIIPDRVQKLIDVYRKNH